MDNTFWEVISAAVEQIRDKANMVARGLNRASLVGHSSNVE